MTDSTIATDVQTSDDGIDAFLTSFDDDAKKRPSAAEVAATDAREETPAKSEDTTEGDPEEATESADPDDQEVEVKVGEETKKATLRELKRLYGQEAALTQKSQKTSEALREAETQTARVQATSKAILERAQARYTPYSQLDWLVLAQRMDTETFEQLRKDATDARADVDFLTQEVDGFMREQNQKAAAAYQTAAQDCIRVLTDPTTGIEGFGKPLYDEMMTFCTEQGLPAARTSINPAEYKILHMAMQYAKAQKSAKAAEAKAEKAQDTPKRVLKPGQSKTSTDTKRAAMSQLRESGEVDDAANAFRSTF